MKNYEKYEDEIRKFKDGNFCEEFVIPHILKSDSCAYLSCSDCGRRQMLWFVEEYEEPEIDWSQVEVDTPILVKYSESAKWKKRHFAKYENGLVYAWNNGETSWTTVAMTDWNYAKLAEDEKEPEIDWSKVKVDTPILVRQGKNGKWLERHFAKYENGDVYAWVDGQTSWTGVDKIKWKYSKLAEDEKECKDPKVDWSKIEVDTAIYVKASKYGNWFKRHFAEYKNGKIYTWGNGLTSHDTSRMMEWKYAKLAENEEPEVDWSKVKVDTPILVRVFEGERWKKRYFAKVEDGFVYAWTGENTSLTANGMTRWSYAKLAEDEEDMK